MLTASGCAAAGRELDQFFDVAALGAVVTKSIMLEPRSGRATPRMAETPSGMLNSIGLQGPGIDAFLEHDLPWLHEQGARAVVSIAGSSVEEYAELAQPAARRARAGGGRGQHLLPQRRPTAAWSSPATRTAAAAVVACRAAAHRPVGAGLRQALAGRHRHRRHRPRLRRRRRGRAVA